MISKDKFKPFILLFLAMAAAAFNFWLTSRYPDLASKGELGGEAPLSGLGFGPLYEITPNAPVWEKLFYGTLNWLDVNRRGMTFAFILGAFLLSLLPLLDVKRLKGGFQNGFLGLLMGAPLGLCVNCTAPVARAMQATGMSLEAALAMLISSPTMNVVVLTMAFAMFPFYVVALKILFVVLFVLVIIPLSCRYLFQSEVVRNDAKFRNCPETTCDVDMIGEGWFAAMKWSVVTYIKNFIRIFIMTAPLMLLAGFLGTAVVTFLPWSEIKVLSGDLSGGAMVSIMLGIAVVGALLPAPMAFDVAMSAALLQAGVPMAYVSVFLFTLGAYSIYAFFIVWQAISLRVASFLLAVTVMLGLMMGMSALYFEAYYTAKNESALQAFDKTADFYDPIVARTDSPVDFETIKTEIEKNRVVYTPVTVKVKPENLAVDFVPFIQGNQTAEGADKAFTRFYGDDFGITQPYRVSYLTGIDILPRNTMSVATGDVHQDGWEDILILGDHEVSPNLILYANIGGKKFLRQEVPAAKDVVLVAMVDLDGDGWQDIVYATYEGLNFVIYNYQGQFREENRKPLNSDLPGTTNSMSFGDLDKDGTLEILLGNWNAGPHFINNSKSKDMILTRMGDKYREIILPGLSGETLTSMLWDFNRDGNLDVFIGNDFVNGYISSLILLGDGKGNVNPPDIDFVKSIYGGQSTMSIDVGDIDNDLKPEYFIGHLAFIGQYLRSMSKISDRQIRFDEYCGHEKLHPERLVQCQDEMAFKKALSKVTHYIVDACENIKNSDYKKMCEVHHAFYKRYCIGQSKWYAHDKGSALNEAATRYAAMCRDYQDAWIENSQNPVPEDMKAYHLEAANESRSNVLLFDSKGAGQYHDVGNERGVGYGGWTWNTRFVDLDNDGWQDIYVSNGYPMPLALGTKVFYRNKGDGFFEDMTKPYGLEDFSMTSSYSAVDFDHDGDLDIMAVPLDWPVKIFKNNKGSTQAALQIELRDTASKNHNAIGAVITVRYKTQDGKDMQQMRVIKGSGGYKSFDAPLAHFGLGTAQEVFKIEVQWPDGKKDTLEGGFKAGGRYRVTRS